GSLPDLREHARTVGHALDRLGPELRPQGLLHRNDLLATRLDVGVDELPGRNGRGAPVHQPNDRGCRVLAGRDARDRGALVELLRNAIDYLLTVAIDHGRLVPRVHSWPAVRTL